MTTLCSSQRIFPLHSESIALLNIVLYLIYACLIKELPGIPEIDCFYLTGSQVDGGKESIITSDRKCRLPRDQDRIVLISCIAIRNTIRASFQTIKMIIPGSIGDYSCQTG